jgi:hypothetical protein
MEHELLPNIRRIPNDNRLFRLRNVRVTFPFSLLITAAWASVKSAELSSFHSGSHFASVFLFVLVTFSQWLADLISLKIVY